MTIKDLSKLLKQLGVSPIDVGIENFPNTRIAIDTSNMMYKKLSAITRSRFEDVDISFHNIDKDALINPLIRAIIEHAIIFIRYGLTPVFVFDGRPPIEKLQFTSKKRSELKNKKIEKMKELEQKIQTEREEGLVSEETKEEYRKNFDIGLPIDIITTIRDLLIKLGIPTLQSKEEADPLCAALVMEGRAFASFSEDKDHMCHGCPRLLTEFKKGKGKLFMLSNILETLDLSFSSFIDMCIMMGSDYGDKIRLVGPMKSYNYIKEWNKLENANIDVSILNYERIREIFKIKHSTELIDFEKSSKDLNACDPQTDCFETFESYGMSDLVYQYVNAKQNLPDDIGEYDEEYPIY